MLDFFNVISEPDEGGEEEGEELEVDERDEEDDVGRALFPEE